MNVGLPSVEPSLNVPAVSGEASSEQASRDAGAQGVAASAGAGLVEPGASVTPSHLPLGRERRRRGDRVQRAEAVQGMGSIGLLERVPERYPLIAPFVEDAEAGQLEIVIANTSVVELQGLKGLREGGTPAERTREIIRDFLSLPYVIRRPLHHTLADFAGELAYTHRMKRAADAVALAVAAQEGIDRLHTFDGSGNKPGLISLSGKVGTPPVTIEVPNHGSDTLFADADTKR